MFSVLSVGHVDYQLLTYEPQQNKADILYCLTRSLPANTEAQANGAQLLMLQTMLSYWIPIQPLAVLRAVCMERGGEGF
jgi:hypothetical protein